MTISEKTVGDEVTTSRIGKKWYHQYNEYSAKEREGKAKYFADMLRLSYHI